MTTSTTPSCNGPPNESYNINHNKALQFYIYALLIHDEFMKEYFKSFDDIEFFHTFS